MQLFSADATSNVKKILKIFFANEKLKKTTQKSCSESAQTLLFHSPALANGPQPKIDFPYYKISGP